MSRPSSPRASSRWPRATGWCSRWCRGPRASRPQTWSESSSLPTSPRPTKASARAPRRPSVATRSIMIETLKAFGALSEEFVEVTLRHDPVAATLAGIHDYDARLPDDTPEGFRAHGAWLRDFEQRIVTAVPWEGLPAEARVDYAVMRSKVATM